MRLSSFNDAVGDHREKVRAIRRVPFEFQVPDGRDSAAAQRRAFPYVPSDPRARDERCYEAYNIQVHGADEAAAAREGWRTSSSAFPAGSIRRTRSSSRPRPWTGWACRASTFSATRCPASPRATSPCRTRTRLMKRSADQRATRSTSGRAACRCCATSAIPYARGEPVYDVTFENVQAGERTSHLFRLANFHNGIVLGTGDLSELALGWCTYGVGDHMSHYNVNASVPKTLIQHLIRWVIGTDAVRRGDRARFCSRSSTRRSRPSWCRTSSDDARQAGAEHRGKDRAVRAAGFQSLLRHALRFSPQQGRVPQPSRLERQDARRPGRTRCRSRSTTNTISATIKKWLEVFLFRFFQTSQFKRSCLPNGPKVGSGGSLSPRGDWRAPSDSEATVWLDELRRNVPDE